MTAQEILEAICRHRANPMQAKVNDLVSMDMRRKSDEIEWALQALAEKQIELEDRLAQLSAALASDGA